MRTTIDDEIDPKDEPGWPLLDEDRDIPEPGIVLVDTDDRTPEEAGYGHGV